MVVSISQVAKAGLTVSFQGSTCKIANEKGQVVGTIPSNNNGLYRMEHVCAASAVADEVINIRTLHRRLGHAATSTIRALIRSQAIQGISLIDDGQTLYCESCEYAKATRKNLRPARLEKRSIQTSGARRSFRHSEAGSTILLLQMTTPASPLPGSSKPRARHCKLTRTSRPGFRPNTARRSNAFIPTGAVSTPAGSSANSFKNKVRSVV